MAKRQRTLSPPPRSMLASPPDSVELPDSKRPRRHINNESYRIRLDDKDKELDDKDKEIEDEDAGNERLVLQEKAVATPHESLIPAAAPAVAKYESANSLLYEVHVLHQHHLLFSPPDPRLSDPKTTLRDPKPTPLPPERLSHPAATPTLDTQDNMPGNQTYMSEMQRVKEHYESDNKYVVSLFDPLLLSKRLVRRLLGSLFLSRRRNALQTTGAPNPNLVL
jgi:hypothetical protein